MINDPTRKLTLGSSHGFQVQRDSLNLDVIENVMTVCEQWKEGGEGGETSFESSPESSASGPSDPHYRKVAVNRGMEGWMEG